MADATPFGVRLREWRATRGVSQLELASAAASTPRHISFLETGRSRPKRSIVLRIGRALTLPPREVNDLLLAAGLPPEHSEHRLDDVDLEPFRFAVDAVLSGHDPFPACVVDRWGQVVFGNRPFERLSPGAVGLTAEDFLELSLGTPEAQARVTNWVELTYAYIDRMSAAARRYGDERLHGLVRQAEGYVEGHERPTGSSLPHGTIRIVDGEMQLTTFTTFLRFENASDVTLSELTVELIFPADEQTRSFFEASSTEDG